MDFRKQIVITNMKERQTMFFLDNQKAYDILAEPVSQKKIPAVGDIYVGKVKNVVKNINAAFVEFQKGVIGYLPLSELDFKAPASGTEFIVQVRKAAVKTKQAVLTIYPELVGQYVVLSIPKNQGEHPEKRSQGVSRKIEKESERQRLKEIQKELSTKRDYGVVIRTNAENIPAETIEKEYEELATTLDLIVNHGSQRTPFSLLYEDIPFYEKYIQGCRKEEYDRIITDDREVYELLSRRYSEKLVFYEDKSYSLRNLLGLTKQLEQALGKMVWLKSGGNLVIEPTEALTVIDVNTGKAIQGKRNSETTFLKTNLEAAVECARQIRLRNLSGIILIDFIDMKSWEHQQELMDLLRNELKKDKVNTALVDITKLGLVEITRMKLNKPLRELFRDA